MATRSISEWVTALNTAIGKTTLAADMGLAVTLQPNGDVEYSIVVSGVRTLVSLTWLVGQLRPSDQTSVWATRANNEWVA
jgi:hypothetical protein